MRTKGMSLIVQQGFDRLTGQNVVLFVVVFVVLHVVLCKRPPLPPTFHQSAASSMFILLRKSN